MVVNYAASAPATMDTVAPDRYTTYHRFHDAVTRAQLVAWLPSGRRLLVDVSGPRATSAELAAYTGHTVLRVLPEWGRHPPTPPSNDTRNAPAGTGTAAQTGTGTAAQTGARPRPARGQLGTLVGDTSTLAFLPDECADGVIAGDRALSTNLAAESMVAAIARVLRPAGRVLACVDSLVLGMAVLAGQNHWPHLADLPNAEVVLIPWPDGTITRCYGPEQLRELFTGAGLAVSWMRPLTVFSESLVTRLLRQDPDSMPRLVRAELGARTDEAFGAQLVISARKL